MMCFVFFFKQKTAYEMRISDWSSDVCSSDLYCRPKSGDKMSRQFQAKISTVAVRESFEVTVTANNALHAKKIIEGQHGKVKTWWRGPLEVRSEEHTSELQSLMRNSYAVFCLKKKNKKSVRVVIQTVQK